MTQPPSAVAVCAPPRLSFVVCASQLDVLSQRLLASPCLQPGLEAPFAHIFFNAPSAAHAFNAAMQACTDAVDWLIWVHQDVFLPAGWVKRFQEQLTLVEQRFARVAVVGVYGLVGQGAQACRAGRVLDRGVLLQEPSPLPCLADSLDELLLAVRVGSGLQLDAALGFDFYATDVVLQAQALGWSATVVDAYCEHWSSTPKMGDVAPQTIARIKASASVFEHKWSTHLPITTPCFHIDRQGDVARFLDAITPPDLSSGS